MSDIIIGDTAKWKIRIMMMFLQNELTKIAKENNIAIPKGKSIMDIVHDDLRVCPNRGIRLIYKKLIEAGSSMKTHYQSGTIVDLAPFILWVLYHDTAYRDPLFWVANELLNDPVFKEDIQPFIKQPSDWYCPTWSKSKKNTLEQRETGAIPSNQMSADEQIFVPEYQEEIKKDILKYQTEMKNQLRLRNQDPTK